MHPVYQPKSIDVRANAEGAPQAVRSRSGRVRVQSVLERWELEDEWWTGEPVARAYFQLLLASGPVVTVYREARSGAWFLQKG